VHSGFSWVIYTDPNYEVVLNGMMRYLTSFEYTCTCETQRNYDWSSARAVGIASDNTIPSVTFFETESQEGEVHITDDGISNIQFPFGSFITIGTNVEFFLEENYQGESFCFPVNQYLCSVYGNSKVCYGGYWDGDTRLPFNPSTAKSAKIGCRVVSEENNEAEKPVGNRIHPRHPRLLKNE